MLRDKRYLQLTNTMEVNVRTANALKDAKLDYILEVVLLGEVGLLAMDVNGKKVFGRKQVNEISDFIEQIGLTFETTITDAPKDAGALRTAIETARKEYKGDVDGPLTDAIPDPKAAAYAVLMEAGFDTPEKVVAVHLTAAAIEACKHAKTNLSDVAAAIRRNPNGIARALRALNLEQNKL